MRPFREETMLRGTIRLVTWRGDVADEEALEYLDGLWRPRAGRILRDVLQHNLITNVGRADVASRITGSATTVPTYIAVGTTVIAPAATDTVLTGELLRKACSTVATLSTYYGRWVANFTTGDFNATVRGVGLFTAAAAGNLWAIVSANTLKDATLSLVTEWRWLVNAA